MKTIAVIPARYASTRFPGKPLALIAGVSMIQRCYENTCKCKRFDKVIVATDDQRIFGHVTQFGGKAVMTSENHQTGTDRIAEAIQGINADLIINVQGDEPMIPPSVLEELIDAMVESKADMGTAAVPFDIAGADPNSPNAVKVVLDNKGFALYFSRSLIPFPRTGGEPVQPLLHWGLYAYTRDFLQKFVAWPQSPLEKCEKLEQLRALENGARIMVIKTKHRSIGVDTPEDLAEAEKIFLAQ
ncbi:MAG: 3-deoxy-manno-octulosonate cytidylyltransferase [Lentisphaerae bacterium]|jgi:3-deoxy-manno-octulosonate cytidylyltransferase (CMP-KDO synthetase)|nr:3-deoxy-manno-octulosonate cytidylyltransferase [Lentisphaerota bacterium]